ncbi:hypothetical protein JNO12_02470 [Erwinia aphidicola]|nr:hypothetical protein [Erwinia aphidicola]
MPDPLAGLSSGLHRQPFRLIINAEREGAHVSNPGGVVGVVIAPELPVAVRLKFILILRIFILFFTPLPPYFYINFARRSQQ